MYYKVVINHTSRGVDEDDDKFRKFDTTDKDFSTLALALAFIKEQGYKNTDVQKDKIYVDYKGKAKQVGWIFTFINSDVSHASEKWVQADWVEIFEMSSKRIDKWDI